MKIVVLMKRVPDLVEDLEVDGSGKALATEHLKLTVNEFDDHALEEGLLLKETSGGELTVVALDAADVDKMLFTALAKGADRVLKITGAANVEGNTGLAAVFEEVLSAQEHDLILTGVQAADDRDGQLGPIVAALLDVPCVEVVTQVEVGEPGEGMVTVHKEYSGGVVAELEISLPAVLGIQAARQSPRYAPVSKVRQIQQSATIETLAGAGESSGAAAGGGSGFSVVEMTAPETGAGAQMLAGVDELMAVLEAKGVV
ncbi:MAG: electron transfer flavoprotein subunit beta/FixA family protein [Acidobacteriota bacterium]|nr:electron transfer flavoprotein subunit beta/FixA family protein [Acidobacteriota bacterium]